MAIVYKLDPLTLEEIDLMETFESLIWTERFIEAGEFTAEVGATHVNAVFFRPGSMLLHEGSDEPMLIETRDIKDGKLTATGHTVETFFNERYIGPYGHSGMPANIIRYAADNIQTRQSGKYAIPNIRIQDYEADSSAMSHREVLNEFAKGYDTLLDLAKKYSKGIAVKRQRNPDTNDWELVFVVRDTTDRTKPDDYVLFSPDDETFTGIDEMYSLADWVDVILIHAPKPFATNSTDIAYGWWPMSYPEHTDQGGPNNFSLAGTGENPFDWRILEITVDDITQDFINQRIQEYWWYDRGYPDSWDQYTDAQKEMVLRAEMMARGKDEWHKRQTQRKVVFDGQVPGEILKFGVDYHLGDIVVVEGNFSGARQNSMVSEHIRSSDGSGSKSYPTLAPVLDTYTALSTSSGGGGGNY